MAEQLIVDGIEVFEKTFSQYKDSFVIIGGTACRAMLSEGIYAPRRTEDIDMVLVLDRLDKDFIDTFWAFIKSGMYRCATRKGEDGQKKYVLYSFYDGLPEYPSQIELLSKPLESLGNPEGHHIEVISVDDASYLSAIILEPDYYDYLTGHTKEKNGLRYASVDSIIILKVLAYLNLREDKRNGKHVNDVDFKKHRRDVVMAAASLSFGEKYEVTDNIRESITCFINAVKTDGGVRQSISASLNLADDSLLDSYLKILDDSFIVR
jgi:hypothetical protein